MSQSDRYFVGPGLRDKLRDVIRRHDSAVMGGGGPAIPVRLQDMQRNPEKIRLGTISMTWAKGGTATVTQINGDGTAMAGNPTFTARNHFIDITVTTGTKKVACGLTDATWILIAAECE